MSLGHARHFENYRRVLSQSIWSRFKVAHRLLSCWWEIFASCRPILLRLDNALKRSHRREFRDKLRGMRPYGRRDGGAMAHDILASTLSRIIHRILRVPFHLVTALELSGYPELPEKRRPSTQD
jgi:hypothetical protein